MVHTHLHLHISLIRRTNRPYLGTYKNAVISRKAGNVEHKIPFNFSLFKGTMKWVLLCQLAADILSDIRHSLKQFNCKLKLMERYAVHVHI